MPKALLLLLACFALGATSYPPSLATYEFGFSLSDQQYFIYKVFEDRVIESAPISLSTFVRQASGVEQSRANPEGVDLFAYYRITGCALFTDSSSGKQQAFCTALNDLWKLRYGGASSGTSTSGWSTELNAPSERQCIILQVYRSPEAPHWLGPYFGKRAFQLLHDMQDPAWVSTYSRGG